MLEEREGDRPFRGGRDASGDGEVDLLDVKGPGGVSGGEGLAAPGEEEDPRRRAVEAVDRMEVGSERGANLS